ncbi:MAG: DsbC family protein [Chromatiales bacterium]|nr:DsbC family protein [Chromatiales bacterium]
MAKTFVAALLACLLCLASGALLAQDIRSIVKEKVSALPDDELIVYSPTEPRYTVTIFTDVNCPYCRSIHRHIDDYLMWDIRVRYAAFPNIGNAYPQMNAVWCSDDRHDALSRAKRDEIISAPACDNPVRRQLELARELRLIGTPAIVTPAGNVLYGRIAPPELFEALERERRGEASIR